MTIYSVRRSFPLDVTCTHDSSVDGDRRLNRPLPVNQLSLAARIRSSIERATLFRVAVLVSGVVALAKLPFIFVALGEQDHGRLIMDAVVYSHDGADTARRYGIYSSPLWTLPLAWLHTWIDIKKLILASNIGGWLCGAAMSGVVFALLERLGSRRSWAIAGGLAAALVPGTFYMSLYGYPSQYALALLLSSALAFAISITTTGRASVFAFALTAVLYTFVVLTKIDFGIAGSLLVAVAISCKKTTDIRTFLLPLLPALAGLIALTVTNMALNAAPLVVFLRNVDHLYPWQAGALATPPSVTVVYSCGVGTLVFLAAAVITNLSRRALRNDTMRDVIAWMVAVLPVWLFWMARPPMSNRHSVPGVVATVLFAALIGSRLSPRARSAAVWLIALIAINWPFGQPNYDFNYKPSGNLASTLRINRRAFTVAEEISRRVAESPEKAKILVGQPSPDVLGYIDLAPFVEVEMASAASRVRAVRKELEFTYVEDRKTILYTNIAISDAPEYWFDGVGFYAVYGDDTSYLDELKLPIVRFSPNEMYERVAGH